MVHLPGDIPSREFLWWIVTPWVHVLTVTPPLHTAASPGSASPTLIPLAAPSTASSSLPPTSSSTGPSTLALKLLIPFVLSVNYALARYLGLSLPPLVDPWRSLLIATSTAAATYFFAAAAAAQLAATEARAARDRRVLRSVSHVLWAVLVALVLRERGMGNELAMLVGCFAGVSVPAALFFTWVRKSGVRT